MSSSLWELVQHPLPRLCNDLPGIGGGLKGEPEDFVVEEIPVYLPSGEGEHLFLWLEKRDLSAEQLQQHLVRTLSIGREAVGMAGLKDRRAITRQWVSVPVRCADRIELLNTDQVRLLEAKRHTNKLKTGHLRGNRFSILLRDVSPEAVPRAEAICQRILQQGFPNYFGEQRFGIDGETLDIGQKLLDGRMTMRDIHPQRRKFLGRLALSAVQSALFNAVLAERIRSGTVQTVQPGDVLQVVQSGGPFVSVEPLVDQPRFDAHEVVTTGPLFGPSMKAPVGAAAEFETAFLARFGMQIEQFSQYRKLTSGARRPLLIWLDELAVNFEESGLRFEFSLPVGTYATVLLQEFRAAE